MAYKSRFESRDEVQLPFVPQGVAANMCDATVDAMKYFGPVYKSPDNTYNLKLLTVTQDQHQ